MNLEWKKQSDGKEYILFESDSGKVISRILKTKEESYYAFVNGAILAEYISLEHASKAVVDFLNGELTKQEIELPIKP